MKEYLLNYRCSIEGNMEWCKNRLDPLPFNGIVMDHVDIPEWYIDHLTRAFSGDTGPFDPIVREIEEDGPDDDPNRRYSFDAINLFGIAEQLVRFDYNGEDGTKRSCGEHVEKDGFPCQSDIYYGEYDNFGDHWDYERDDIYPRTSAKHAYFSDKNHVSLGSFIDKDSGDLAIFEWPNKVQMRRADGPRCRVLFRSDHHIPYPALSLSHAKRVALMNFGKRGWRFDGEYESRGEANPFKVFGKGSYHWDYPVDPETLDPNNYDLHLLRSVDHRTGKPVYVFDSYWFTYAYSRKLEEERYNNDR